MRDYAPKYLLWTNIDDPVIFKFAPCDIARSPSSPYNSPKCQRIFKVNNMIEQHSYSMDRKLETVKMWRRNWEESPRDFIS